MCEEDENHGLFPSIGAPGQRNVSAFPLDAEQIPRRAVTVMGTAWVKVIDAALNWDIDDVGMSTCPRLQRSSLSSSSSSHVCFSGPTYCKPAYAYSSIYIVFSASKLQQALYESGGRSKMVQS